MSAAPVGGGERKRSWICALWAHKWAETGNVMNRWRDREWECERCGRANQTCDNCGGQHNPNGFTICSVTRSGPTS